MDSENAKNNLQKQLNAGATSLAVLALHHQLKRAMYGYEVAKELEARCEGSLPMKPGALYPVLRSLEKQGLLSSFEKPSDAGPSRKYYQITDEGIATLKHWRIAWQDTKLFVDNILENKHVKAREQSHNSIPRRSQSGAAERTARRKTGGAERRSRVSS